MANPLLERLRQLPSNDVPVQYVWIDGTLKNFRTKDLSRPQQPTHVGSLPLMEFCGSATDFDVGNEADYYSKPVRLFRDPFRPPPATIALCETHCREGLPTFANNRFRLRSVEKKDIKFTFWQLYSVVQTNGLPLSHGLPENSPALEKFSFGREVSSSHYDVCLHAGVQIASSEYQNGQWRYSVGENSGVSLGDDVWLSRYLLLRIAEEFGVVVQHRGAQLQMQTEHLTLQQRNSLSESLLSKSNLREIKMATIHKNIVFQDLSPDVDPYAVLTRVHEAIIDTQ